MKKIILLLTFMCLSCLAKAQIEAPVKWSYASKKINKTTVVLFLKAEIKEGWHIYSAYQINGGPVKTTFVFKPSKDYLTDGKIIEPKPIVKFEKAFDIDVSYFEKSVIFQQKIKLKTATTSITGHLEFMVCNDKRCLSPETIEFSIPVNNIRK